MGLYIFEIKLCWLNSSVGAAWSEIWFMVQTSWSYKSRTEKVTVGRKSAILPNWCCLLLITVLSDYPCFKPKVMFLKISKIFTSKSFLLNFGRNWKTAGEMAKRGNFWPFYVKHKTKVLLVKISKILTSKSFLLVFGWNWKWSVFRQIPM